MSGSGLFTNQAPAVPHLSQGEVADLRADVARTLLPMAAITVEEFTNLAATNTAGLKAATAVTVAPQTISSFLSGAAGTGALAAHPRSIKFTTADVAGGGDTSADAPATGLVTGKDVNGNVISETVNIAQTDGGTVETVKCYSELTSVVYSAAQGTGATIAIGVGTKAGFRKKLKARAGFSGLIREIQAGVLVTTPTDIVAQEWTNPAALATDGLKAATATAAVGVVQTVLASDLLAPGVAALLAFPRNLTFTTAGADPTHAPASVTITGTDIDDAVLVETLALSQSATTDQGVKAFKTIVSIVYGVGVDTDATIAIGFGKKFGLLKSPKFRAGVLKPIQEIAIGAVVAGTGTMVDATTSPPHGTYAPSANPNGTTDDFAVYYEYLASAGSTIVDAATSGPNGSYTPSQAFDDTKDFVLYYEYDPTA